MEEHPGTPQSHRLDGFAYESEKIRFGSFSLGDVLNNEIRKLGRFAFRDKRSSGKSSKKFVDEFVRSAPQPGRTERGKEICSVHQGGGVWSG